MVKKILNLSNLTLLTALALSTVAAYYSIYGLTAIFAGAVVPIIIMGGILEVGKIVTTVWLRKYWHRCSWVLKLYLVPAVVLLALLTSMGIFGFLSKAHTDSGLVSGDVQAKLSLIDEKIKTQRDNIEIARKALTQMDAQVDARLNRGDSEQSAERAVQIRRQQQGERAKLQKEIGDAQKVIATLNEERAPIAAENRKVEAEVGPIKYVAALIYGDNPDSNLLERAVRWVIILLVVVFDPLAIALVLAANASRDWDKDEPKDNDLKEVDDFVEKAAEETLKEIEKEESILDKHPYLTKPWVSRVPEDFRVEPQVFVPEVVPPVETTEPEEPAPKKKQTRKTKKKLENIVEQEPVVNIPVEVKEPEPVQEEITADNTQLVDPKKPYDVIADDYVLFEGKSVKLDALKELRPDIFMLTADHNKPVSTNFGTKFPEVANKGDMFVRVDSLPNKVFKYDGNRWIEVSKEKSDTYLYNEKYIQYLINKLDTGEYDPELLSDHERSQIEYYLKHNKIL